MSDCSEVYALVAAATKAAKETKHAANLRELYALGIEGTLSVCKNVFRITGANRNLVIYYPASGKWQHGGRVMRGTPTDLKAWLKEQSFT